jgi:hypothetical protein
MSLNLTPLERANVQLRELRARVNRQAEIIAEQRGEIDALAEIIKRQNAGETKNANRK